ncbi:MAG: rhomboid family intramembrane serine protease [Bacteroidetes bacterium]|nr:rhomboid family intramembrane serine protease [Bacteroidota bacterium]
MNSFLSDIIRQYRNGSVLIRILFINIGVFVAVKLVYLFCFLFSVPPDWSLSAVRWFSVPADVHRLLWQPWSVFTYMFLHEGFWHIAFNMLMLYWGGTIFLDFLGNKNLILVYIAGGLFGSLFFILAYNLFPVFEPVLAHSLALGASASVLAVMIAVAAYVPDYTVFLLFVGPVRFKYVAALMVLIDIVSIESSNPGGHIAHLGGAFYGFLFAKMYRRGFNLSGYLDAVSAAVKKRFLKEKKIKKQQYTRKFVPDNDGQFSRPKRENRSAGADPGDRQKKIDEILDKISQSGYTSLTKTEKDVLFKYSREE